MSNEEFILECRDKGMNDSQISQIREGLNFGLHLEEVKIYAKNYFDPMQMNSIRLAVKNRLSKEEIAFMADKKFNGHQMEQIVTGLKEGLTLEKVKEYALPDKKASEMCECRLKLMKETVIDAPGIFSKEYYDRMLRLSEKQTSQMRTLEVKCRELKQLMSSGISENDRQQYENLIKEKETIISELKQQIQVKDNIISALVGSGEKSGSQKERIR